MKLAKMAIGRGALVSAGMVATVLFSDHACADDPYADYIKLSQSDTDSNDHSWNQAGNWDDPSHEAPSADKNYYVPAGMELYRPASTDTNFNFWKGGKLVLAGIFNNNVSACNNNGPAIPDLVLLGGSDVVGVRNGEEA